MAEYIDRVQLLADIENTIRITAKDTDSSELRGARKVIDRIKAMPSADVIPAPTTTFISGLVIEEVDDG